MSPVERGERESGERESPGVASAEEKPGGRRKQRRAGAGEKGDMGVLEREKVRLELRVRGRKIRGRCVGCSLGRWRKRTGERERAVIGGKRENRGETVGEAERESSGRE